MIPGKNVSAYLKISALLLLTLCAGIFFMISGCQPESGEGDLEEEAREAETFIHEAEEENLDDSGKDDEIIDSDQLDPVEGEVALESWEPMRLVIPSIELDLEILSDKDTYDREEVGNEPWNFSTEEYNSWIDQLMPLLSESPVHYQFSSLPGTDNGNVAIAGHSPGPWYHFYDLDLLEEGDQVYLETDGYRFIYEVEWSEVVDKYDWSPLFDTDYPALTFQTCHPKDYEGFDHPERLMVRAELERVLKLPQ